MINKKKYLWIVLLSLNVYTLLHAQSYWFGAKGGAGMNFQSWGDGTSGNVNRDPLFSINGDIIIESYDEFKSGALYAQLGYHTRGSSLQFFSFNNAFTDRQGFKFNNIVLELGAKKAFNLDKELNSYFILGLRGEYTISNNLDNFLYLANPYTPHSVFVRKINYGVTAGGGFEMPMSELVNVFVEFSIQPDISLQYEQPPARVIDPWQPNQTIELGLRQVRNLSLELKVGVKFLRKVEYID
ncbi:MAG: hypothetical protein H7X99_04805 [Saprospiraceae bacterium]|nr:hypothetical protein [Saprospiraceae bacterium]